MINEPIKITNLETLHSEKQRLKMYCEYKEQILKDKINYLRNNPKQIIAEEFLPFNHEKNQKTNNILDIANKYIFEKFLGMDLDGKNKLSGVLIKLTEVLAVRLFNSFRKKSEK